LNDVDVAGLAERLRETVRIPVNELEE